VKTHCTCCMTLVLWLATVLNKTDYFCYKCSGGNYRTSMQRTPDPVAQTRSLRIFFSQCDNSCFFCNFYFCVKRHKSSGPLAYLESITRELSKGSRQGRCHMRFTWSLVQVVYFLRSSDTVYMQVLVPPSWPKAHARWNIIIIIIII